jgi:hypothetical protein
MPPAERIAKQPIGALGRHELVALIAGLSAECKALNEVATRAQARGTEWREEVLRLREMVVGTRCSSCGATDHDVVSPCSNGWHIPWSENQRHQAADIGRLRKLTDEAKAKSLAFAKCYEAAIAFLEVSRRIDEADPAAAIAMLDAKQFSKARELLEEAVRKATTSTKC